MTLREAFARRESELIGDVAAFDVAELPHARSKSLEQG
jgi:hypothetical protein